MSKRDLAARYRVRRPAFRRSDTFVVVKYLRLGADLTLAPGDEIPAGKYAGWRLRRWMLRGLIGPKDHPWTEAMVDAVDRREARLAARSEEKEDLSWGSWSERHQTEGDDDPTEEGDEEPSDDESEGDEEGHEPLPKDDEDFEE